MALPNTGTIEYTRDVRDSSDPISQEKPLFISNKIWINDPNENKLLSAVMRDAPRQPVYDKTFGHLEDAPFPNWVTYAGADETSSQATDNLTITDVQKRCAEGSRLMNARTKEILRLTLDPDAQSTTQTVARNFGRGAATDYLLTGDRLFILPPAMYEGFTTGKGMSNAKTFVSFKTGVISYPIHVTNTEQAARHRGRTPFEDGLFKSWKQSKDQMEGELLYGAEYNSDSVYAQSMHTATGLESVITTNVYNLDGVLTRFDLWDILTEYRLYHKGPAIIACSQFVKNMVTEWAFDKVVYDQSAQKDGLDIEVVKTPAGEFLLTDVDVLNQEEHLMGEIFVIPYGHIAYCPLEENMNLDVAYNPISRDEVHQKEGEIYGEYGWEYFQEETFLKVNGLEF